MQSALSSGYEYFFVFLIFYVYFIDILSSGAFLFSMMLRRHNQTAIIFSRVWYYHRLYFPSFTICRNFSLHFITSHLILSYLISSYLILSCLTSSPSTYPHSLHPLTSLPSPHLSYPSTALLIGVSTFKIFYPKTKFSFVKAENTVKHRLPLCDNTDGG